MYDRERTITFVAVAAVLAALLYYFWPVGDCTEGPTACGVTHVIKEEADIVVIDPTSDASAWIDARANILDRISHAFGQKEVEGTLVGDGSTGNITLIPIGSSTSNSDSISVLDYQNLTSLRDKLYGSSVSVRAKDIYDQVLSGDANSLWNYLVEGQLRDSTALQNFELDSCETIANNEIQYRIADNQKFSTVISDIGSNGITTSDLTKSLCAQISDATKAILTADEIMSGKSKYCRESIDGKMPCSDVHGATKVIKTIINDLSKIDKSRVGDASIQLNVCTLFASDMWHYDTDGPLKIRDWDRNSISTDQAPDATSKGTDAADKYLGIDGYPVLSGGSEVYMPYLGDQKYNNKLPIHDVNELQAYWTAFFDKSNVQINQGSSKYACTGKEAHIN